MEPPTSLFLLGLIAGIAVGIFYALSLVANLLRKRIVLDEKPALPNQFPEGFQKHSHAAEVLMELLGFESGYRLTHKRRKEVPEVTQARISDWLNMNPETVSDTVEYLEMEQFVVVERHFIPRKNVVTLTDKGKDAARWLEENFTPTIFTYLVRTYPNEILVRLLRELSFRRPSKRRPEAK